MNVQEELRKLTEKIDGHKNPSGGFTHEYNSLKGRVADTNQYPNLLEEGESQLELQELLHKLWNSYPEYQQGYLALMEQVAKQQK